MPSRTPTTGKSVVLVMLGLGVVAFLVALLMFAFGGSKAPVQEPLQNQTDAFQVQTHGDQALRELASEWSERALVKCFAPDLYNQPIYTRMAARLPNLKESLGQLDFVQSSVTKAPSVKGDYLQKYEYRATGTFRKGKALVHMAIYAGENMIEILGIDIEVSGEATPKLDLPEAKDSAINNEKPDQSKSNADTGATKTDSPNQLPTDEPVPGNSQL